MTSVAFAVHKTFEEFVQQVEMKLGVEVVATRMSSVSSTSRGVYMFAVPTSTGWLVVKIGETAQKNGFKGRARDHGLRTHNRGIAVVLIASIYHGVEPYVLMHKMHNATKKERTDEEARWKKEFFVDLDKVKSEIVPKVRASLVQYAHELLQDNDYERGRFDRALEAWFDDDDNIAYFMREYAQYFNACGFTIPVPWNNQVSQEEEDLTTLLEASIARARKDKDESV